MGYEYVDWSENRGGLIFRTSTIAFTVPAEALDEDSFRLDNAVSEMRARKVQLCDIDACLADFERQMREGR